MQEQELSLKWTKQSDISFTIPSNWWIVNREKLSIPSPPSGEEGGDDDLRGMIRQSLDGPVGLPPLSDLVYPSTRVALIMDDKSRPTPVSEIAPVVLDYLVEAGVEESGITGLFAIGTHKKMSGQEMRWRAGEAVYSRIRCLSIGCKKKEEFRSFGTTRRGTEVGINRIAAEADMRILIGTIEAHPQAGFGGGYKNIVPGLAADKTIAGNHLLMPSARHYNMIASFPGKNPMRLDLEEAASRLSGNTFIVNTVLDPALQPLAFFSGHPVKAHRTGIDYVRKIYGIPVREQTDVVITSAYPMEDELRQAGKAILNVAAACKKGGLIIAFLPCEEGLGNVRLPRIHLHLGPMRLLTRLLGSAGIVKLVRMFPSRVRGEERFLVNFGLQILKDYNVMIYSPALAEATGNMWPSVFFRTTKRLFDEAGRRLNAKKPRGKKAADRSYTVSVFNYGGVSFPVF